MSDLALTNRNPRNGKYGLPRSGPVFDDTMAHEVMLRLVAHRAKWWADEDGTIGSKLHTIKQRSATTKSDAEAYAREALKPMTDAKRITVDKVDVSMGMQGIGTRLVVVVYWTPRGGQQQTTPVPL